MGYHNRRKLFSDKVEAVLACHRHNMSALRDNKRNIKSELISKYADDSVKVAALIAYSNEVFAEYHANQKKQYYETLSSVMIDDRNLFDNDTTQS